MTNDGGTATGGGGDSMRVPIPSDVERRVRFYGRFTWKELIRLALPAILLTWLLQPDSLWTIIPTALIGLILGLTWYTIRPYGQGLEIHLYHKIRWLFKEDQP